MWDWLKKAVAFVWSGWGNITWFAGLVSFTTIAALAARATGVMAPWAPMSWVGAGGLGFLVYAIGTWLYGVGRSAVIRSRYDARLLAQGGAIDPLSKTFERKRIFLNEFVLPSLPYVEGKTFIDCEIIGPANVVLRSGNHLSAQKLPFCDGYVLADLNLPNNGYVFDNCHFRGCSFNRISLMVSVPEFGAFKDFSMITWRGFRPDDATVERLRQEMALAIDPPKLIEGPERSRKGLLARLTNK